MTSPSKVVLGFTPGASSSGPVAGVSATLPLSRYVDGAARWHKYTITRGGITVPLKIKEKDRGEMERKEDALIDLVLRHATAIKFDYSNGFVSFVDEHGKRYLRQVSQLTRGDLKAEQCYKSIQQKLSEISGVRLGLTVVEGKRASDTCFAPLQRQGKKTLEGLVAQQAPSAECAIERFGSSINGLPKPDEKKIAVRNMLTAFNGLASALNITKVDWLALHTALAFSLHAALPVKVPKSPIDHTTEIARTMRFWLQAHINRLREARWDKDQASNPYPKDPGVFARDAASLVFCFLPSLEEEILASRLYLGNEQKKESAEVHLLRYVATGEMRHLTGVQEFQGRDVDQMAVDKAFEEFQKARSEAMDCMSGAAHAPVPLPAHPAPAPGPVVVPSLVSRPVSPPLRLPTPSPSAPGSGPSVYSPRPLHLRDSSDSTGSPRLRPSSPPL